MTSIHTTSCGSIGCYLLTGHLYQRYGGYIFRFTWCHFSIFCSKIPKIGRSHNASFFFPLILFIMCAANSNYASQFLSQNLKPE